MGLIRQKGAHMRLGTAFLGTLAMVLVLGTAPAAGGPPSTPAAPTADTAVGFLFFNHE